MPLRTSPFQPIELLLQRIVLPFNNFCPGLAPEQLFVSAFQLIRFLLQIVDFSLQPSVLRSQQLPVFALISLASQRETGRLVEPLQRLQAVVAF